MEHSALTIVAINAALKAGELLRNGFYTHFRISYKEGMHNLVTECDHAAEESIISSILNHFPSHSILAEESGEKHTQKSDVLWIVDPLDGTVNFAHRIPFFAVSIGVAVKEELLSGVVYCPTLGELFIAEKGKGAYLNGTRLSISSTAQLLRAFIATGFPYNVDINPQHCIDRYAQMQHKGVPVRRMGSAALDLAYVAAGRYDAFWELNLKPWDTSAGTLLVEEAGGTVSQYSGEKYHFLSDQTLLATNGHVHQAMIEHLNQREPWRG
ncbi:MAG TPA: inositol monophosphatase family protein [Rhabdochlamydiaceae bacterium]|jgi:myo-inositol-1(or 4)-monophosphatase